MPFRGAGSTLAVGDAASPEVFTAIGEVIEISGPDRENPEIEVTNLSSTAREYIAGLRDEGTVEFEAHFEPSNVQQAALWTDFEANPPTSRNYRVTWNDPSSSPNPYLQFAAFVQRLPTSTPPNDSVKVSVTLRITGSITRSF